MTPLGSWLVERRDREARREERARRRVREDALMDEIRAESAAKRQRRGPSDRRRRLAPATGVESTLWAFAWATLVAGVGVAITETQSVIEAERLGVDSGDPFLTFLVWLGAGMSGWALWGLGATVLRFLGDIRERLMPEGDE